MSRVNASVHDQVTAIIDTIDSTIDPADRLAAYRYLESLYQQRIIPARDRAAYEARLKVTADDLAAACDVTAANIYYWSDRHRLRAGLGKVPRRTRAQLDAAKDLNAR